MPKERPILFSGEMIHAILDGRKRQTRRVCKFRITGPNPPKDFFDMYDGEKWLGAFTKRENTLSSAAGNCPYGMPSERLWVRETLQRGSRNNPGPRHDHFWRYAADNSLVLVPEERHTEMLVWATHKESDVCVSIHMPRWASRITLEITDVRVERLQEISGADILAEGVDNGKSNPTMGARWENMQRMAWQERWDKLNAGRTFGGDVNPWVWVIEFKPV